MKARLKASYIATNKQKKIARELVEEELKRQGEENTRRIFKLFCLCLNDEYGFGKFRLSNIIRSVYELSSKYESDEVFWIHIDDRIEQIGLDFEKENYKEMDL